MSNLPIELCERILDLVPMLDHGSLRACTLVHSSWLPRSRAHIFGHIDFSPEQWTDNVEEIFSQAASGDERWELFVALLERAPHIRLLVRSLEVSSECPNDFLLHGRLAVLLPAVTRLSIRRVAVQPALILAIPNLRDLAITSCRSLSLAGRRPDAHEPLRSLVVRGCGPATAMIFANLSLRPHIAYDLEETSLQYDHLQLHSQLTTLLAKQRRLGKLNLLVDPEGLISDHPDGQRDDLSLVSRC
jgi:hypothetical protein